MTKMPARYQTFYAVAAILFILAGLLNSAPYPADIVLFFLGLVALGVAAYFSARQAQWHLAILSLFSVAVFGLTVLVCDPVFLGLRLPPFNGPIERGIHPVVGVIVQWGLIMMGLLAYEIFWLAILLFKRAGLKQAAAAFPGMALQGASLWYVLLVVEGI